MTVDIHHLIAAICPDVYCDPTARKEVKRTLRERLNAGDSLAYLKAAEVAQPREPNTEDLEHLQEMNPFDLPGLQAPTEKHTLVYDAPGDSLERVYFLLLDLLERQLGWQVTKLVDLVSATPGSTLAQQWGQRPGRSIDETLKLFEAAQLQVQRLLTSLDELRRVREQLQMIEDFRSADSARLDPAAEVLKGQWHEHRLARNASDDAGMPDESDDAAFQAWVAQLQRQLTSRHSALKGEARAQLQTLRVYARLLQPFLADAPEPNGRQGTHPGLLSAFNTATIRVVLMAQEPRFLEEQIAAGILPKWLGKERYRPSIPTILVELSFRAIPEEAKTGGFVYRGRAEITLTSYALREDETRVFLLSVEQMEFTKMLRALGVYSDEDVESVLTAIRGLATTKEPESGRPKNTSDVNPFAVLWSILSGIVKNPAAADRERRDGQSVILRKDSPPEAILGSHAILFSQEKCRQVWDGLKAVCSATVGAP